MIVELRLLIGMRTYYVVDYAGEELDLLVFMGTFLQSLLMNVFTHKIANYR